MPDITQLSLAHNPDIFTIICFNDGFQHALDLNAIKTLLRVCKRAQSLLSSKVPRLHSWCQSAELCHPDRRLRIGLTPSDKIAISLHCKDQGTTDRSWIVALASRSNTAAWFFMARILQLDLIGPLSANMPKKGRINQRILRHLKKAADAGHLMAQLHLAGCYNDGIVTKKDYAKAFELYQGLAERGMAQAQVALGRCYENGEGVDQDFDTAIDWYSKAADQASEDGRLHIAFFRGWFSFIGRDVDQSDADAFSHWQEVSTQSINPVHKSISTHMVGWMHYLGRGTQQDKQKGVKIIRDNESDEFKLGETNCLSVIWSSTTSSDSLAAREFFELCRIGSDRDWLSNHLMAVCLVRGFGTMQDRMRAAGIFEQLANEGYSDSQFWIGECFYQGWGGPTDRKKAFEWFSKSADQGNWFGEWMVGLCYLLGTGVTRDRSKAIEWYRKSAEQGYRYPQASLGDCYKDGWGVDADIDTAVFWYRKSADQGYQMAINSLIKLGQWPSP
ncbi:uncharacterized protein BJ171DRAFT_584052 [Polychytrium aggregatum]|uniref:uncharacterized protein n=1 Tax=Polychytrium aggregatum TaxID=110093 RepID=UPI0022FEC21B|nr:uncharacterized protein BJ171DRAFT_584052 [Polychytrium aggregatum]KAI9202405.1 hypothetical protein BJ171DRAFT_584052 [Polychytrium aggregatum]